MFKSCPHFYGPAALIVGLVVASVSLTTAASPGVKTPDTDEIRDFLAKRVEILKERMDMVIEGHTKGVMDAKDVHEARRDYWNAKLDLSANIAERITVLREIVEEAEAAHKTATAAVQAKIGDKTETLKSHAYVLEMRVALARAENEKQ
jgi:outer membrane protein TolC